MNLSHPIKIDFGDDLSDVRARCDQARSILRKKNFSHEEVSFMDDFVVSLTNIQFTQFSSTHTQKSPEQMKLRERIDNIFENIIFNLYLKREEIIKKAFPLQASSFQLSSYIQSVVQSYETVRAANYSESARAKFSLLIKALPAKGSVNTLTLDQNKNLENLLDVIEDNCMKIDNAIISYISSPLTGDAPVISNLPKNFEELVEIKARDFFPDFNSFPRAARLSLKKIIFESEKGIFDNNNCYRFYQIKDANLILVSNRSNLKGFQIIKGNLRLVFSLKLTPGTCVDTELLSEKRIMLQTSDNTFLMTHLMSRKIIFEKKMSKPVIGIRIIAKNGPVAVLSKEELNLYEISFGKDINLIPIRKISLDLKNSYIYSFIAGDNILVFQKRVFMANYEEASKIYFINVRDKDISTTAVEVSALPENQDYYPIGDFRIIMPINRVDFLQCSFSSAKIRPISFYLNERGSDGLSISSSFLKYGKSQSFE